MAPETWCTPAWEPWVAMRSTGLGFRDMDLGVQKNLHISEGKQLELHGDAFNVTNTPSFANPSQHGRSECRFRRHHGPS